MVIDQDRPRRILSSTEVLRPFFGKPARSLLALLLGLMISAIGIWLIARDVDSDRWLAALRSADYRWISAATAMIIATFFCRMWRWAAMLRPMVYRSPAILKALLIGQVLNFVLPIRIGDLVRAAMLSRSGGTVERVLGSVAIEKAWDWIALTLLVFIVAVITPLPDWFIAPARVVGIGAAIVLIGFAIVAVSPPSLWPRALLRIVRSFRWLPHGWSLLMVERLQRVLDSLHALRTRAAIGQAALYSIITWLLGIAANYAVMRAFGLDSWIAAMLLMAVLMIGITLPPSIAAVGLFEGLTILTLSTFNLAFDTALAIGVTLHLVIFVPPLFGAGLSIVWTRIDLSHRGS